MPEDRNEPQGDWDEPSEGELDPDLTEEAGYAWWEPTERGRLFSAARIVLALAALSLLGSVLLVLL